MREFVWLAKLVYWFACCNKLAEMGASVGFSSSNVSNEPWISSAAILNDNVPSVFSDPLACFWRESESHSLLMFGSKEAAGTTADRRQYQPETPSLEVVIKDRKPARHLNSKKKSAAVEKADPADLTVFNHSESEMLPNMWESTAMGAAQLGSESTRTLQEPCYASRLENGTDKAFSPC